MSEKISIITVNLNNRSGLKRTLESVFSQDCGSFEILVVDGGSTDGSVDLIRQYAEKISWWVSEKDGGIYEAMNKGIARATGEYLQFLNSGDYLYSGNMLSSVSAKLDGTDIVYGNMMIEQEGRISEGFMPDKITLAQMMRDTLWHPVSFIRRQLFELYGPYKTEYRICADYEFFFRTIIVHNVTTRHIQEFIAVFQLNGMSSDPRNAALIKEEKERIQAALLPAESLQAFRKATAGKPNLFQKLFSKWFR